VNRAQAEAFDATRDLRHMGFRSACYAPSASMYFDVRGNVIACCQSTTSVLGNVNEQPLEHIWRGPDARAMRERLADYEHPSGCEFCAWQVEDGNHDGMFSVLFDRFAVAEIHPDWPVEMEFALSNTCNLQCVMCDGDFSSTIRARREHRPPLASAYGDGFFEQLRPFLPHLRLARFFGGEPFLIPEYQRIWDLMIEVGATAEANATTNGTIRSRRVEDTLDQLRFSIGVSLDGASRETIESVRVGADFDVVMGNVAWFRDYCERVGTGFGLTYCLMTVNWHEFADFLRLADDLGAGAAVNTVTNPPSLSLYGLPRHELDEVVATMAAQAPALGLNAPVWEREVERLRHWGERLIRREASDEVPVYFERRSPSAGAGGGPVTPRPADAAFAETGDELSLTAAQAELARLGDEASTLVTDRSDTVVEVAGPEFLGLPEAELRGRPFLEVLAGLERLYGRSTDLEESALAPNAVRRVATFRQGDEVTHIHVVHLVDDARGETTTVAVVGGRSS
jgi:radical SAM protein with 4Fe4S-binding SPASM domain